MAGYFNKVILMGNLVRDPELRYTPQGTAVTDITIAINDTRSKNSQNNNATFVDVTVWDRSAEVVCEYMHKGSSILVEGRLVTDRWEDRESGKRMSKLKVVANSFQFTDSRGSGDGGDYNSGGSSGGGYQQRGGAQQQRAPRQQGGNDYAPPQQPPQDDFGPGGFAEGVDDIPF